MKAILFIIFQWVMICLGKILGKPLGHNPLACQSTPLFWQKIKEDQPDGVTCTFCFVASRPEPERILVKSNTDIGGSYKDVGNDSVLQINNVLFIMTTSINCLATQ